MNPVIVWTVNIAFIWTFIGALLWAFIHATGTAAHVRLERMAKGKPPESRPALLLASLGVIVLWPWVVAGRKWGRG